jgi:hypothetical protein
VLSTEDGDIFERILKMFGLQLPGGSALGLSLWIHMLIRVMFTQQLFAELEVGFIIFRFPGICNSTPLVSTFPDLQIGSLEVTLRSRDPSCSSTKTPADVPNFSTRHRPCPKLIHAALSNPLTGKICLRSAPGPQFEDHLIVEWHGRC